MNDENKMKIYRQPTIFHQQMNRRYCAIGLDINNFLNYSIFL